MDEFIQIEKKWHDKQMDLYINIAYRSFLFYTYCLLCFRKRI